jgi:hypothetical protein
MVPQNFPSFLLACNYLLTRMGAAPHLIQFPWLPEDRFPDAWTVDLPE